MCNNKGNIKPMCWSARKAYQQFNHSLIFFAHAWTSKYIRKANKLVPCKDPNKKDT